MKFSKYKNSFYLLLSLILFNISAMFTSMITESVFSSWLCLEMSVLSFLGMLITSGISTNNPMLIYFSFQIIPSLTFLTFVLFGQMVLFDYSLFLGLVIFLKIGVAPFHSWFMSVALQLPTALLTWILTVQKLIPLQLISMISQKEITLYFIFVSILVSMIFLVIQTQFKKILIASSIFSNNWVLSAMITSPFQWKQYFICYSILILMTIILFMKETKIDNLIFSEATWGPVSFFIIFSLFLGGFPPSPLFMIKIMILKSLLNQNLMLLSISLIISSAIGLLAICNLIYLNVFMMNFSSFTKPFKKSTLTYLLSAIGMSALIIWAVPSEMIS